MDDVDSVQAVIARNMLQSGDWVTARLDGIKYLEKAPAWYWMIATCFGTLGVRDWAGRIPVVLSAIGLCWLMYRMARWAGSAQAGVFAGMVMATSVGLFLFTRILIPDVSLTLCIAVALWSFLRATEMDETRPRAWAWSAAAAIAAGILLKGLIASIFPLAIAGIYLVSTGKWKQAIIWKRLHIPSSLCIAALIAAPWHVLATLRNPPYFVATLHSGPGEYKGFAWFYFINEHLLRFLNLRYPRDYNTVPRFWFWALHLVWFFPWGFFLPAALRFGRQLTDRTSRLRLLAVIWIGFVLMFFSFSTTQEYYSMPCYPALALLLGFAMTQRSALHNGILKFIALLCGVCCAAVIAILIACWNLPIPGDISVALSQHPDAYTLSLGHMGDLTIAAFAYLRLPLVIAAAAFIIGSLGAALLRAPIAYFALALMMVLFFHAARLAMVVFDPYLSSRPIARALLSAPPGTVIFDDQFYTFSSVAFYTGKPELLLNGRVNNLEYGSNAADAPNVFIDDKGLQRLWAGSARCYLLAEGPAVPRLRGIVGAPNLHAVAASGGKYLFTNRF